MGPPCRANNQGECAFCLMPCLCLQPAKGSSLCLVLQKFGLEVVVHIGQILLAGQNKHTLLVSLEHVEAHVERIAFAK